MVSVSLGDSPSVRVTRLGSALTARGGERGEVALQASGAKRRRLAAMPAGAVLPTPSLIYFALLVLGTCP
eukprot:1095369-Pleurochrysis_carterae.AAC.1